MADINRIKSMRQCDAMVALDNFDLITARIRKLLSYDCRVSMTHRYTYTDSPPELFVGLTVDRDARNCGITDGSGAGGRHFGVHLRPGLMVGFGFSAYPFNGNGTEAEAWARYHGEDSADLLTKRRDMTKVTLVGGLDGDVGPDRGDLIVVRAWNGDGVCIERVIGFDADGYWAEQEANRQAEDEAGAKAGERR